MLKHVLDGRSETIREFGAEYQISIKWGNGGPIVRSTMIHLMIGTSRPLHGSLVPQGEELGARERNFRWHKKRGQMYWIMDVPFDLRDRIRNCTLRPDTLTTSSQMTFRKTRPFFKWARPMWWPTVNAISSPEADIDQAKIKVKRAGLRYDLTIPNMCGAVIVNNPTHATQVRRGYGAPKTKSNTGTFWDISQPPNPNEDDIRWWCGCAKPPPPMDMDGGARDFIAHYLDSDESTSPSRPSSPTTPVQSATAGPGPQSSANLQAHSDAHPASLLTGRCILKLPSTAI